MEREMSDDELLARAKEAVGKSSFVFPLPGTLRLADCVLPRNPNDEGGEVTEIEEEALEDKAA